MNPKDAARVQRLRDFGLSDSGARAYLALLALGETEARDIARTASIPLSKVYQTLEQLLARGLALSEPTTPRRYAPVPFPEFLEKVRDSHRQQIKDLDMAEDELATIFAPVTREHASDRGRARIVRGRQENLRLFRTLIARAEHDILIMPSRGWLLRSRHIRGLLDDVADARIRILAHAEASALPRVRPFLAVAEVRQRDHIMDGADPTGMLIVDSRDALLMHFVPDDASLSRGEDFGLHVSEAGIVASLRCTLESRWRRSTPLPGSPAIADRA